MISNEVMSCVSVRSNHLLYLPHEIKTMFGFFLMSSLCANKYILVNIFVPSCYCFHLHTVLLISKFAQLSLGNVNRFFSVIGSQHSSCLLTVWSVVLEREGTSRCRPGGLLRAPHISASQQHR